MKHNAIQRAIRIRQPYVEQILRPVKVLDTVTRRHPGDHSADQAMRKAS